MSFQMMRNGISTWTIVGFLLLLYIIFFTYRDRFFFFPLLNMIDNPLSSDVIEEVYFENEMGAWVYPPRQSASAEKIMIYFNGNAGNVSTRVSIIKVLRQLLPEYKIFNLEYPGFGLCSHLHCSLQTIVAECETACRAIIRNHPRAVKIGFWGESIGALIQAKVFSKMSHHIHWVVQMNGVSSLTKTIGSFVPNILHGFVLPVLPSLCETREIYEKCISLSLHRVLLFHASDDEIVEPSQSIELFFSLKHLFPSSVYYCELLGKHNGVLLNKENQEAVAGFLGCFDL